MNELLALPDVYLVSVQQMLGWMANPLPASQTKTQWVPCRSSSSPSSSPPAGGAGGGESRSQQSPPSGASVSTATPSTAAGAGQTRNRGRTAKELVTSSNVTNPSREGAGSMRPQSNNNNNNNNNNNEAVIFAAPNDSLPNAAPPPPGSRSGPGPEGEGGVPERLPEIYPDALLIASLQAMDERRRNGQLVGTPGPPPHPPAAADPSGGGGGGGEQQHKPLDDGTLSAARESSSDEKGEVSHTDNKSHTAQHAKSGASSGLMEVGMWFTLAVLLWILV
jgi:hypothetical protein